MIRYIGPQLNEPQDIQYKDSQLLIIPAEGNKQLYEVVDDGNYSSEYEVDMILNTDLYTHIIISSDLVTSSIPEPDQICYAIEDLDRDPDDENMIFVPFPVNEDYSKFYIYLTNYDNNQYQYFSNVPAIVYLLRYNQDSLAPLVIKQTEHFTYIDNTDFECVGFERVVYDQA